MQTILTLHDPKRALSFYRENFWRDETMYDLLQANAAKYGSRYAIRDARQRLTWTQLLAWVDSFAATLSEAGLVAGDRVAVWLPSRIEAVVSLLACSRNGYICCPSLHQNHTVAEIAGLLERVLCRAFVGMPRYGADADVKDIFERTKELASIRAAFSVDGKGSATPFPAASQKSNASSPDKNPDKIVYIAFTSGTTGQPKGVMHSDNTLLANGRQMVRDWAVDQDTVLLSLSPISHHIATVALEQVLVAGCELVLNDLPSGWKPLQWVEETKATYVMGVPTHAMDLLTALSAENKVRLGAVKYFYMAGSPIPPETAERFVRLGVTPQNVYGMTENGSHQYTLPTDSIDVITTTCGRACGGYEVRLFNPERPDEEVQPGEIGEIGSRGSQLMLGYFADQKATEGSFNRAGWFLSGDLGQFFDGNLRIVGRKKDLIIRGGHNIAIAY